ncbi:hypothetical protein C8J55DRAFT_281193 [Lentinula edodes]|uniref:Uncharacterized protein n=1 Tax=Lentinula lateritia TaxID=40482 RepID=A0A9W9DXU8_9AGAR|nr:hypothetical protein C8J55DRAFT_281193 [Lentinula edodes]
MTSVRQRCTPPVGARKASPDRQARRIPFPSKCTRPKRRAQPSPPSSPLLNIVLTWAQRNVDQAYSAGLRPMNNLFTDNIKMRTTNSFRLGDGCLQPNRGFIRRSQVTTTTSCIGRRAQRQTQNTDSEKYSKRSKACEDIYTRQAERVCLEPKKEGGKLQHRGFTTEPDLDYLKTRQSETCCLTKRGRASCSIRMFIHLKRKVCNNRPKGWTMLPHRKGGLARAFG